jgi:hypothetical protein
MILGCNESDKGRLPLGNGFRIGLCVQHRDKAGIHALGHIPTSSASNHRGRLCTSIDGAGSE